MSISANYPNGFAQGHTSFEIPLIDTMNSDGNVFWVDSTNGLASDSAGGRGTFQLPFATLNYAISRCSANNGDKIFVAAGHTETIIAAGGITADVAGISIIGMGHGDNRPTITFTTSTTATLLVSAADVLVSNLKFVCNIASQATMIDCNAKRTIINKCKCTEGSATGLSFIDVNGGAANACDGVEIHACEMLAPTAGNYSSAIELGEVADGVKITGCYIRGDFDDAAIHNPTGKVLTNLLIADSTIGNLLSGAHAIELVSACTGFARNLYLYADAFATAFDPGALFCMQTYSVSAGDVNARLNPVVET